MCELGVFFSPGYPVQPFPLCIILQEMTSVSIITRFVLCGPGLRQSRLHHRRSTRGFTVSEMVSIVALTLPEYKTFEGKGSHIQRDILKEVCHGF